MRKIKIKTEEEKRIETLEAENALLKQQDENHNVAVIDLYEILLGGI